MKTIVLKQEEKVDLDGFMHICHYRDVIRYLYLLKDLQSE